ncbi:MAG: putative toxin-antitoxin system toxin component, PIN family [Actinomycetes bacterium]
MRAVVDPNVAVSAALSPNGAPAAVLLAWLEGQFEMVASPRLIAELDRTLAYPKIRKRIPQEDSTALVRLIERGAVMRDDVVDPPSVSRDAGDDYLIALARASEAVIVSGDGDLLALAPDLPVFAPASFLAWLEVQRRG